MSTIFSFPGTTRLEFDWQYPDPPEINYKLAQLEAYLENTYSLMLEAKEVLRQDMQEKFETETDPSGQMWRELKQPEQEQIGILRRGSTDAAMYRAAIDSESWDVTSVGVFFDTSNLPPYWVYHEQPEGAGGQRIPQRAFVDASAGAQATIEAVGYSWLQRGVDRISSPISHGPIMGIKSPATGSFIATMGQTTVIGGVARREVKDPATGRFVSTRPEFYS